MLFLLLVLGLSSIDLLIYKNDQKLGFEIKYTDKPKITNSMRIAINDLKLDALKVIIPGRAHFGLEENIEVYGIENLKHIFKSCM